MTPDDLAPYDDGKTWRTEGLDSTRATGLVALAVLAGYTVGALTLTWALL